MSRFALITPLLIAIVLLPLLRVGNGQASQLLDRALKLSNNQAAVQATWNFSMGFTNPSDIALISFEVCSNDPFPNTVCTVPNGLDVSDAQLVDQAGNTGFAVSPSSTANRILIQRQGSPAALGQSTYTFTNILNPADDGSYYVRLLTYDTSYVAGDGNNYGGIAFAITPNVQISATVPPYLLFCVGVTVNGQDCEDVRGDYVDFGEFSPRRVSQGSTQMLAATNAEDGYSIRVNGPTFTSGNSEIKNLVGSDISRPGTGQFGMNLRANNSPGGGQDAAGAGNGLPVNGYNQINFYRYNAGDMVAASSGPDRARKYTSSYIVNVPSSQAPGVYVTTLNYIALGSF